MTKQEAFAYGQQLANKWLICGEISGKRVCTAIKADFSVVRRQAEQMGGAIRHALTLLERTAADALSAFRYVRRLTAVDCSGKAARLLLLGEGLSGGEVLADEVLLRSVLEGVQSVEPLSERELSLLMSALQAGILHALSRRPQEAESLIQALNRLQTLDLRGLSEEISTVHQLFSADSVYSQMDEDSRSRYRSRLAVLAKKTRQQECGLARSLMEQCAAEDKHVGQLLFPQEKGNGRWYPTTILTVTLLLGTGVGILSQSILCAALSIVPLSQVVVSLLETLLLRWVPQRPVLRLELSDGLPTDGRTLAVVSAIVSDEETAAALAAHLEQDYLSNRSAGEELRLGVLADLRDSAVPPTEEAESSVFALKSALERLDNKYGERFYLFYRKQRYQRGDECYRGHERKRGALMELLALLSGRHHTLQILVGESAWLGQVRYLLALDSDTRLNQDSVRRLVGAMLHPLNRPVVDRERRMVVEGHGLLQPRIGCHLSDVSQSRFAGLFGGLGGVDPYTCGVSDLYQDVFQAASYNGKGLLDVRAAVQCLTGRFPENRVLSHDLLEGAFLRAGFVGDVELTDGFPTSVEAFLRRQHRWIRGDWQAAAWLLPTIPQQNGEKVPNPLRSIDRWKLVDNLRRSLLPVCTLIALLSGMMDHSGRFFWAGLSAAVSMCVSALLGVVSLALRGGRGGVQRLYGSLIFGLPRELLLIGARLLLLSAESWNNLHAVCTALFRLHISHKKLLEWVPSQTQSAQGRRWNLSLPSLAVGVVTVVFAVSRGGKLLGLLWCAAPLILMWMDDAPGEEPPLSQRERSFLMHQSELMWQYFEENLREEFHFLPPDNVQQVPYGGAAPRTSPTNIGLSLLSCLAALDLGLTSRERAVCLIEKQLTAVEQLEKERGHLYNWYGICTAQPLFPRYVSTVDSGNLCSALIALAQGLDTLGERALAERARHLAAEMRFSFLYDWKKDLFYIGWDVEKGEYTPSHYDLMASEARATSYLTVARNEVPHRHWRTLSRVHVTDGLHAGLASWTGTMFEYFMPALLLPAPKGTLIHQALLFCAYGQRQWGKVRGIPWGVSESGFFALNDSQSYRYKAHGVPSLALSHDVEEERVVAPYAAFLALSALPHAAVHSLMELRAMGMEGRYGLYEAIDFTARRTGGQGAAVRSWMVHHLGMSLLAVDNALCGNIMVERFLSDSEMKAARELLEERPQTGISVIKRKPKREKGRRKQVKQQEYQRSGVGFDTSMPECHLLSEGDHRLLLFADGSMQEEAGNLLLLECVRAEWLRETTVRTCFPSGAAGECLQWSFGSHDARLELTLPEGRLAQQVEVRECGTLRQFSMEGTGTLRLTLCPVLDKDARHQAHRAFSRLGLVEELIPQGCCFRRRGAADDCVLTLLWDREEVSATLTEDSRLILTVPVEIGQLSLAAAYAEAERARPAAEALLLGMHHQERASFETIIARHHLTGHEVAELDEILSCMVVPQCRFVEPMGQRSLWPFGVSGDDPIWLVAGSERRQLELCVRQWQTLRELGARLDLVLLVGERSEDALRSWLSELTQIGGRCGVHLVVDRPWSRQVFRSVARLEGAVERRERSISSKQLPPIRPKLEHCQRQFHWEERRFVFRVKGALSEHRRWSHVLANETFGCLTDECGTGHLWWRNSQENQLTRWQNDPYALCGSEALWLEEQGVRYHLFAAEDGAVTTVTYGAGWARWERDFGERKIQLFMLVPNDCPCRWLSVRSEGFGSETTLFWQLWPMLSNKEREGCFVTAKRTHQGLRLSNGANDRFPGQQLFLECPEKPFRASYCFSEGAVQSYQMQQGIMLYSGMEPMGQVIPMEEMVTKTEEWWRERCCDLEIETVSEEMNHYCNFWSRYQVLACRLYARCGLYQCGGAYGFRDQLQDAVNLLPFTPSGAKKQILRCCAHQYEEGDVMHWWHPMGSSTPESGVRTHISDDLLWLPWAVSRYVAVTGDVSILQEEVPFLTSAVLGNGEESRFEQAVETIEKACVFEHCARAIEQVLMRGTGTHGLCLMGGGDWNDGMDQVGIKGRGESVWLTWFAALVLREFAPLCDSRRQAHYGRIAEELFTAADNAWDGEWYRRAYTDEGAVLGGKASEDCHIDSIAQSFAVLAAEKPTERSVQAVRSAVSRLYDPNYKTVALLTPPFVEDSTVGYIADYPEGVRENGGQYTHAAVWLSIAALRIGEVELGWQLLRDLLPSAHDSAVYQGEPYVLAGDVSTAPGKEGHCGWSWYTGAAGWYLRAVTEELLGLRIRGGVLRITPRLPKDWPGYRATLRWKQAVYHIEVKHGAVSQVLLAGVMVSDGIVLDDWSGEQTIEVTVSEGER